jgi:hypothetical protein
MSVGMARVHEIEEWATEREGSYAWRGFFGSRPNGRTGIRRVRLGSLLSENRPTSSYAELHVDGAGFACEDVGRRPPGRDDLNSGAVEIPEARLPWALARILRLLGRHAVENTGAWGDASVVAHLSGPDLQLTYPIHQGMFHEPWNHEPIRDPIIARNTLPLEAMAGSDQNLLAATRVIATDLVNAFGAPEVHQIDDQGRVRLPYVPEAQRIEAFAESHAVEVTRDRIPG